MSDTRTDSSPDATGDKPLAESAAPRHFEKSPDDFVVHELPLYEASGEGEHLYVRFEKRGWNTRQVIRRAAERFGIAEREIGYAGLKDKHATTTQTISIPRIAEADAARLEAAGLRVLSAKRHKNKLRTGHLAGNRFRARIRRVADLPETVELTARLQALEQAGLPNYYGEQRFGRDGRNVGQAMSVLRRGPRAAGSKWKARFLLSALQSALFNHVLKARLEAGAWAQVAAGDVMQRVESGGLFECEDPICDQPRYDAWELSITGPIFGPSMRAPAPDSAPAAWEAEALAAFDLDLDAFSRVSKLAPGTRRPLRARVSQVSLEPDGDDAWIGFVLPPGAYATVLIERLLAH